MWNKPVSPNIQIEIQLKNKKRKQNKANYTATIY